MRILFVSYDLVAGNLAYLLAKEGHDVKLYIEDEERRGNFDNLVAKVDSLNQGVDWVGKDGLIVFDDVGYGKIQDGLRKKGYQVVGGSALGDKLETNREFGQKVFSEYGLQTVELKDFEDMDEAATYIKHHPAAWVIKRNGRASKYVSYVGEFEDGRDCLDVLRNYLTNKSTSNIKVSLQKKIVGVEIGVGRYFNGNHWVGPIEFNIEHTKFLPGDLGPITSEMGTLAWYGDDETNKLYQDTIAKLEPYLREIGFKGDFELNCIVNETGAYILEATTRFGSPIVHLQSELQESPWGEFLLALAKGEDYDMKWKKGYGIVLSIVVPPFPYPRKLKENYLYGMNIHFKDITEEERKHIHYEEVADRVNSPGQLYISDRRGYIFYVTGVDKTISAARDKVNAIAKKIVIPRVMYRNDIGDTFQNRDRDRLKQWGYL